MTNDDASLLDLGRVFDHQHALWLAMPEGEVRDDQLNLLNAVAERIRPTKPSTMAGVRVKARNLLWLFGLTHAGVPGLDEDPGRFELAAFVEELEAFLT